VRRVAIVGPGLDFADKQEGFDFYDLQSLQPFTTIDSVLRAGLSTAELSVTTIDISPRVNEHLRAATDRARRSGSPYRLVLPWSATVPWVGDAVTYWQTLGDRIGTTFDVSPPPPLDGLRARGVAVRPQIAGRVEAIEANVVYDRLSAAGPERFDLVLATNVLVYYDTFDQTLALSHIATLLRPGGILLANASLLEVPDVPMRAAGYVTVRFSAQEGDGEHVVFYRRTDDGSRPQ
jgi:SAM-dependent methyltransferase